MNSFSEPSKRGFLAMTLKLRKGQQNRFLFEQEFVLFPYLKRKLIVLVILNVIE